MLRVALGIVVLTLLRVPDLSLAGLPRDNIRLVNNGYEGLVIAIGETVPDSPAVIDRIKVR